MQGRSFRREQGEEADDSGDEDEDEEKGPIIILKFAQNSIGERMNAALELLDRGNCLAPLGLSLGADRAPMGKQTQKVLGWCRPKKNQQHWNNGWEGGWNGDWNSGNDGNRAPRESW